MRVKLQNLVFVISSSLMVSACTVQIPDTKICSVAGIMAGGAYCAHTLTDDTEDMTPSAFYAFLEPDETTGKGAALCMSTDDFAKLQIALEQACRKLGTNCSKEVKEEVKRVSKRIALLKDRSSKKPKLPFLK